MQKVKKKLQTFAVWQVCDRTGSKKIGRCSSFAHLRFWFLIFFLFILLADFKFLLNETFIKSRHTITITITWRQIISAQFRIAVIENLPPKIWTQSSQEETGSWWPTPAVSESQLSCGGKSACTVHRSSTNRTAPKLKRSSSDDGKVSPTAAYQDSFRKCSSFFDEMETKQYYPICQHFVTNHMKTNIISFLFWIIIDPIFPIIMCGGCTVILNYHQHQQLISYQILLCLVWGHRIPRCRSLGWTATLSSGPFFSSVFYVEMNHIQGVFFTGTPLKS